MYLVIIIFRLVELKKLRLMFIFSNGDICKGTHNLACLHLVRVHFDENSRTRFCGFSPPAILPCVFYYDKKKN